MSHICAGCSFEASRDFAFCPRCGQRLPHVCATCARPCDADFAFCPHCGAPQHTSAAAGKNAPQAARVSPPGRQRGPSDADERQADRRHVTVLFADLSGFTTLAERLDPEDLRAFQSRLFETLSGVVARHDGFVEKFIGDAVLAVFGAPVAHEDDPERACDAALAMRERCGGLSREWEPRLGQPVALHVGVHTGPVVAGDLGGAAGAAYAVTGDTVNTTARLLAAAPAGTILISEATHTLVRHRFASEAAGELVLRGKTEPLAVHRLLGIERQRGSARGLAAFGLTSAFVGRHPELEQLIGTFDRMQQGHAQVVTLVGEAGIGKSRLIVELMARLRRDGRLEAVAMRHAACSSLGEATYGLFAELFREAYHIESDDSLDVVREKLTATLVGLGGREREAKAVAPVLSHVLGLDARGAPDIEPEQLRRQIVLAARALVERRLENTPILIVVEDLQWADSASVELLRDVADQLADRPLMLLLSLRPEAGAPPFARAERSLLRLRPLSGDETRMLVASLFPGSPEVVARVAEFVVARAGGNPLFVEEIVRNLVSRGVLHHDGEAWRCTAMCDDVEIPPSLHGLLLSRVDRLPGDARRMLQEAAVLGAEFDMPLLQAATEAPDTIPGALGRLVAAELIEAAGRRREDARYRFTHGLVREVVYQNLLLARRTEMHERIGRALERLVGAHPERLSHLKALAHHWSRSSDTLRGARYLVAAGDRARVVYANEDAIRHYELALQILAACSAGCEADARGTRERLADLMAITGRRAAGLEHYEAVLKSADDAGDRAAAARLWRKIGGLHWDAGDRDRAGACFASGMERLRDDGHPVERAHLFQEMGRLAFRAGDNAGAIGWAERALTEVARDFEPADAEAAREAAAMRAHAYNTLGVALARTGRPGEAVQQIERSIALAEAHDLLAAACRGYANLGVLYSSLEPRRSIETCLRGLEIAKKVGDLGFQSRLYANLAVAYCSLTDRCEAEGVEAAQAAIDLDRRLELLDHLAVPLIVLGQIRQCHGDHQQAFAMYEEALGLAEAMDEPQLLFPCYDGLATLHLDAGDPVTAEVYLTKAQDICARAGLEPDALLVLPFLC